MRARCGAGVDDAEAKAAGEAIAAAGSPEEAARIGRRMERARPDLLRADWAAAKLAVMAVALRAKARRSRSVLMVVASFCGGWPTKIEPASTLEVCSRWGSCPSWRCQLAHSDVATVRLLSVLRLHMLSYASVPDSRIIETPTHTH